MTGTLTPIRSGPVVSSLERIALLAATFEVIVVVDDGHRIVAVDGDPSLLLGQSAAVLLDAPVDALLTEEATARYARLHPEVIAQDGGAARTTEQFVARHANGAAVPVEAVLAKLDGPPARVVMGLRNAHKLARMEETICRGARQQRVLKAIHDALQGADDEASAFHDVCWAIVAEAGYPVASVSLTSEAASVLPLVARAGHRGWSSPPPSPVNKPTEAAVRGGETVVVQRYPTSRSDGSRLGCGMAVPIRIDGAVEGALTVEAREFGAFAPAEVELIEEVAARLGRACSFMRARAARRAAEARLAEGLDALDVVAWSAREADERVTYINAAAERVMGHPRAELLATPGLLRAVIHPDDRALVKQAVAERRGRGRSDVTYRIVRPDGTVRWIRARVRSVRDASGAVVERDGIALDVTAQREAEVKLSRREQLFRRLVEGGWDLLALTDADGRIAYAGGAWERMAGVDSTSLVGRGGEVFGIDEEAFGAMLGVLRAHPGDSQRFELPIHQGAPTAGWIEMSAVNLLEDPVVGAIVFNARDITSQKRHEAALRALNAELENRVGERTAELATTNAALLEASRAKDEFLASMSHELRTPLNAVLGLSEALQEEVYGPLNDLQRRAISRVEESGRHLLSLINDVLDVAKMEAGRVSLELRPVAPAALVRASLRLVQESARRKSLSIETEIDPLLGRVLLDERRMKQVLVNLLSNAVKFTPEGGRIGISAEGDDTTLRLTVWDTGIGISPADVSRLFQPFVQLDSSLSRQHTGSGLGLALTRRLVDLHGGTVELESDPGRGSRFTVRVPRRQTSPAEAPASSHPAPAPAPAPARAAARWRVLVVDDDAANVATVGEYLVGHGFEVHAVGSGVEAIEATRRLKPDVLLMDVQMPGMDGLEATSILRSDPSAEVRSIPLVALTALAMPGDRERCLAAGADAYVTKPVRLRNLVELLEDLAARHARAAP